MCRSGVSSALTKLLLVLAIFAASIGCAVAESKHDRSIKEKGNVEGYLKEDSVTVSKAILPPPPANGSTAFALDLDISRNSLTLHDSSRWKQATLDADLTFPTAATAFSCAFKAPVTNRETPLLYKLLQRTLVDVIIASSRAKSIYMRSRPFLVNGEPICTPGKREGLANNSSYPSGHSAVGWAWALILSEISPGDEAAIITRGLSFGQSRVICNVHWQSDVIEGRIIGALVVARLHAEPQFRRDLEAAKRELEAVRSRGSKPERDCVAEAKALSQFPQKAPWPANFPFQR